MDDAPPMAPSHVTSTRGAGIGIVRSGVTSAVVVLAGWLLMSCTYPDSDWTAIVLKNDTGESVSVQVCWSASCERVVREIGPEAIPAGGTGPATVQYGEDVDLLVTDASGGIRCLHIEDPGRRTVVPLSTGGPCGA